MFSRFYLVEMKCVRSVFDSGPNKSVLSVIAIIILTATGALLGGCKTAEFTELCPEGRIKFRGKLSPGLSDTEKRLVCGDEKTDDPVGKAWSKIPLSQAKYSL